MTSFSHSISLQCMYRVTIIYDVKKYQMVIEIHINIKREIPIMATHLKDASESCSIWWRNKWSKRNSLGVDEKAHLISYLFARFSTDAIKRKEIDLAHHVLSIHLKERFNNFSDKVTNELTIMESFPLLPVATQIHAVSPGHTWSGSRQTTRFSKRERHSCKGLLFKLRQ